MREYIGTVGTQRVLVSVWDGGAILERTKNPDDPWSSWSPPQTITQHAWDLMRIGSTFAPVEVAPEAMS